MIGTINSSDLYDLFHNAGYDVKSINPDKWDDFESQFESDCEIALSDDINERKKEILQNNAYRIGINKKAEDGN